MEWHEGSRKAVLACLKRFVLRMELSAIVLEELVHSYVHGHLHLRSSVHVPEFITDMRWIPHPGVTQLHRLRLQFHIVSPSHCVIGLQPGSQQLVVTW